MTLFATPDFGSGAGILGIVTLVWLAVLVLVAVGVFGGFRLLKRESLIARRCGWILLLGSLSVPLFCCLAPPGIVRITYGNFPIGAYPNGKIREGMSKDEVAAVLGAPHERYTEDDGESWYYWVDSFGAHWFCVRFGPEGRVIRTHGN
jgi:hypothetical protein